MNSESPRQLRVADLIHQQLAQILQREVHDPRLKTVSLTTVRISANLKQARVYYTLIDKNESHRVDQGLKKAIGYMRHSLAEAAELRHVPQLIFVYDEAIERGAKISSLIDEAIAADKELHKNENESNEK